MDEAVRWRAAFEAEAEKHRESLAELQAKHDQLVLVRAELADTAAKLEALRRHVAKMQTKAADPVVSAGLPSHELYSCAVCSSKTMRFPSHSMAHHCCDRTVLVGPCCERAVVESPELVQSIMRDCGHAPGCKRGL